MTGQAGILDTYFSGLAIIQRLYYYRYRYTSVHRAIDIFGESIL